MTLPPVPAGVLAEVERLGVSRESWQRIEAYASLLLQWQQRINLISPASIPQIWERHVLDSLQLLPHIPSHPTAIADLGSGAGFPALPLAIASGQTVHLYESNQKKAAFLREAIRTSGAKAYVHAERLTGQAPPNGLPDVDLVTARALAPLTELLSLAQPFLEKGAKALFLKGGNVDHELTEALKTWRIQYRKCPSLTDSQGIILALQEVSRV